MIDFIKYIIEGIIGTAVVMIPVAIVIAADMIIEERQKTKERDHPTYTRLKSFVYDRMSD